jgi:hypothetical protein
MKPVHMCSNTHHYRVVVLHSKAGLFGNGENEYMLWHNYMPLLVPLHIFGKLRKPDFLRDYHLIFETGLKISIFI